MCKMLDKELIMKMYRLMVLSRVTEERMVEYHKQSPLPELPHSGIGQEANPSGIAEAVWIRK